MVLDLVAHRSAEARVRAVEEDGYAYLPGALGAAAVSDLRDRIDALDLDADAFDRESAYDTHIKVVFNRDPFFLRFLDLEPAASLAEGVMGEDCHIIGMTAWKTGPTRPDQNLHVDYLPLEVPEQVLLDGTVTMPVFVATAHYYLDDITDALGPTKFIPGSHRAGRKPAAGETSWRGQAERSLLCQAGDAVLFRSDVWHRGSANTSDSTRYLLQVHYARRMVAQKFPPYLRFRFNPETLAQANPRQRRMLGEHVRSNYD